jgi:hypothetical protein
VAEIARDAILGATLLALIFLWAHQPTPANVVNTPYCVITYRAAGYDEHGKLIKGWARGYGPCSEQDIYRNI